MKIHTPQLIYPTLNYAVAYLDSGSSDQNISDVTNTAMSFTAIEYDTGGWFDLGSDSTIATVPAGITRVDILASIDWNAASGSTRRSWIEKNSAHLYPEHARTMMVSEVTRCCMQITAMGYPCEEGDTFRIMVYQNSGNPQNLDADNNSNWFMIAGTYWQVGDN